MDMLVKKNPNLIVVLFERERRRKRMMKGKKVVVLALVALMLVAQTDAFWFWNTDTIEAASANSCAGCTIVCTFKILVYLRVF